MAHFAELNDKGTVLRVIVVANNELMRDGAESEQCGIDFLESLYGHCNWKQTSYSGSFRGCFAGIGYRYDSEMDMFVPPAN